MFLDLQETIMMTMIIHSKPLGEVIGSPWVSSSGASKSNIWANINVDYSHSSDDRNTIWNADVSLANEYDYSSIGFGGGFKQAFQ